MNLIVVVDCLWGIGRDGNQPFFLREDLRRFRALTLGGCVIMGRRTLEALPGGRPLAGRRNLVLSRDPHFAPEGVEVCRSPAQAAQLAGPGAFVIGGESVYRAMLPWCGRAYVTRTEGVFPADRWMVNLDQSPEWRLAEQSEPLEEDGIRYRFTLYERI